MYTIHKIITILKLAKTHEEKLGVPVVPIFWIAGEDHDFDEINHIYTIQKGKLQQKMKQINHQKQSVSNIPLDKRALETFTSA
ncbi:bacillithiol biosynthesis BshC [Anaerobacillus sp. HL2]|nr:bacillithiol biosynthesis BshC [Anaerobacillus sp. HL2]